MKMMDIPAGRYKAVGIAGSERYYAKPNKHAQIGINLKILKLDRTVTAFLSFAPTALQYSLRKLKALGWKGERAFDVSDLSGIDKNEVDIEVRYESYNGEPRLKVEIVLPGVVTVSDNNMGKKEFMARLESLPGNGASSKKEEEQDDVPF